MRRRLMEFMRGRYGADAFGRFLNTVCLVMVLLALLPWFRFLYLPALLLMGFVIFRMCSRQFAARSRENEWFLRTSSRVRRGASGLAARTVGIGRFSRRDPNLIFACPACGQKIRVPKGRGRIEITCSRCRRVFRKRT